MKILSKLKKTPQRLRNIFSTKKYIPEYVPEFKVEPINVINVSTAWKGLELIIPDILQRFNVDRGSCIEFGVEFGYSIVIFSNYFRHVVGIDTFDGDINTANQNNHFDETRDRLARFNNIKLHKINYLDWIATDDFLYDFAHVDIVHTHKDTYRCGLWAVQNSKCAIFHDTESFIDVRNAVIDIAKRTGKKVYNYPYHYGLGIIASE